MLGEERALGPLDEPLIGARRATGGNRARAPDLPWLLPCSPLVRPTRRGARVK